VSCSSAAGGVGRGPAGYVIVEVVWAGRRSRFSRALVVLAIFCRREVAV